MKLLADVGLIGLPNAGKSTLLAAISGANPKIADYPFSTLVPNLGFVRFGLYQHYVVADIPGLVEGAALGKGLGHQFLRHIERTKIVVVLVDTTDKDYQETIKILLNELKSFSVKLAALPKILVRSKIDLAKPETGQESESNTKVKFDLEISAITGEGIDVFIETIGAKLGIQREL